MDNMNLSFVHSEVQTPAFIIDKQIELLIPAYQRPYVWPDEDVIKLLDDIYQAFKAKEGHYYIGTILTARRVGESGKSTTCYELIDGQQRMTTFMLIALAFSSLNKHTAIEQFAVLNNKQRLHFAIREKVQGLLAFWAGLDPENKPSSDEIKINPYLKNLDAALKAVGQKIKQFHDADSSDFEAFAEFLHAKVKWVNNVMPEGMDLNKLFATMNTSGMQLEQSDILKSQLLKVISRDDKPIYDAIWQCCENMGNYFERNLRQLFDGSNWDSVKIEGVAEYSSDIFTLKNAVTEEKSDKGLSIAELYNSAFQQKNNSQKVDDQENKIDKPEVYCRSIISFSLLLIHTFRIYRFQQGLADIDVRVKDIRLNECFADFVVNLDGEQAKKFLRCLWKVRYQFDRWVVKWVENADENEEVLNIRKVYFNLSQQRLTRNTSESDELKRLQQLQAVRNFTGERSAQYWLTPFLAGLIKLSNVTENKAVDLLESIDNQLSLLLLSDHDQTQKQASFHLLSGELTTLAPTMVIQNYLQQTKGTGFEHYWFQKLEYVLWCNKDRLGLFDDLKFKRYRIAARNSIEHVHPQKEEYDNQLDEKYLHCFGNLVLLSPGENSSYSNQDVTKKQVDFERKTNYDSLKLAHIFSLKGSSEWTQENITQHQQTVIDLLTSHYRGND